MGLDMYMFARQKDAESKDDVNEIGYWRKHNALHHWFETKFLELNPDFNESFNCVDFPMTPELLDELENDIDANRLTPTNGFFFGTTDYDPAEDAPYDLEVVGLAREALKDNRDVFYSSWW